MAPRALEAKPVFYAWGARDRVVPRKMFEAAEVYLAGDSGSVLTCRRYAQGHQIDASEVRGLVAWFAA